MRIRPHTQPTLSSSCDGDRRWPRFPISNDLSVRSVAEMTLLFLVLIAQFMRGDHQQLDRMNTALKWKLVISQGTNLSGDAKPKSWTFVGWKIQSKGDGCNGNKQLAWETCHARYQASIVFTLDKFLSNQSSYSIEQLTREKSNFQIQTQRIWCNHIKTLLRWHT